MIPIGFQFLDPGPLIDGELELLTPHPRWVEPLLETCRHPITQQQSPADARISRLQIEQYLASAPDGREPADPLRGTVPAYHFWMLLHDNDGGAPPVRIAGDIGLRVGWTYPLEMYYGHIGYHVFPPARGHHYAERSCRLLLPLARRHGMRTLWITCNPDNHASRRTCQRLGAKWIETVPVPPSDPLYARGEIEKCRFRLEL